ncbi:MAG: peptide deformylase [Bacilli bacterium]|nr:peptide deformylase [Bacilli bacterium]
MENLEIKTLDPNDKRLREISSEVTDFGNPYYKEVIEQMKNICLEEKAYACAAPQFGVLKRFILIMTTSEMQAENEKELNDMGVNYTITPYFNPKIISMKGKQYFYESCMSVDDATGKVARPYSIELEAQDIEGNYFTKKVEGFETIIFCHEIDHLDGIEYTDKAEKIFYNVGTDERLAIRKREPHLIVSKEGNFFQDTIQEKYKTLVHKKRI